MYSWDMYIPIVFGAVGLLLVGWVVVRWRALSRGQRVFASFLIVIFAVSFMLVTGIGPSSVVVWLFFVAWSFSDWLPFMLPALVILAIVAVIVKWKHLTANQRKWSIALVALILAVVLSIYLGDSL